MTREEACNELVERYDCAKYVDSDYVDCISIEAIEIAIACLRHELQQESQYNPCDNCQEFDCTDCVFRKRGYAK